MKATQEHVLEQEAVFDLHELFFSITKEDSTIVAGNDTFVRISGYTRDEIIGKFHNIVRHDDMPRVIFKTLWDYLKASKPIVAYVKNKTKQGLYYWVFAAVFPLQDRYISIRVKPNSAIFAAVKELYPKLLEAEKSFSIQESEKILSNSLLELGFRDYDHFIVEALMAELLERKRLLLEENTEDDNSCLTSEFKFKIQSLYCSSKMLLAQYGKWFEKIELFNKTKNMFEEKSHLLSSLAQDIVFLSLNASVASYRVDTFGETFGVLARDIRTNAKENNVLIAEIYTISNVLSDSINEIIFLVSSISLQMEMVTYFLKELFAEDKYEFDSSIYTIFELVKLYDAKLIELTLQMEKQIQKSLLHLDDLEQQIMYLGYVQVYGIIESARSNDDSSGFGEIFSQLKSLITKTSDEIEVMKSMGEHFFRDNKMLINESKSIKITLDKLNDEVSNMREFKG